MSLKDRIFAALTSDWKALAETHLRNGDKLKAAEAYARGGALQQAAKLAAEAGNETRAIEYTLRGVLGEVPEGMEEATAEQAGELLFASRHYAEAITLFELAGSWKRAAEASAQQQQPQRAGRFYEKARLWALAALYYEKAGQLPDAARCLEREAQRLRTEGRAQRETDLERKILEVDQRRADLLTRLGRRGEATAVLEQVSGASLPAARLLERNGKIREAIEAYLGVGEKDEAVRLIRSAGSLDGRTKAKLFLAAGLPLEAAPLFVAAGLAREAAEAFETAGLLPEAAGQWEAAKDPARAGAVWQRGGRWRDAARCYGAAGDFSKAAECHARGGDMRGAATALQKGGKLLEAATCLFEAQENQEALRVLRQIRPGDPGAARATILLMPALIDAGQTDEAMTRLASLPPDTDPGGSTAVERFYWQGRIHERRQEQAQALLCYMKVVGVDPRFKDAERRLAALRGPATRAAAPGAAPAAAQPPTEMAGGVARPPAAGGDEGGTPLAQLGPGGVLAGRYEIQAEIGRGGMGRVFRARDRELDEVVAIKTLLRHDDNPGEEERLLREAQICRRLAHPNIVRVFDLGRVPGGIFVTMELIEGHRLDELARSSGTLPLSQIRNILTEVASGLAEAHALQIVHRDLKPSNIIVTPTRVKILDFGIARRADNSDTRLTRTGLAVGTPLYMSPEQLQGMEVDGRSDLYSLGVLIFTLIAGREPFLGDNVTAIALDHLRTPPPNLRTFRADLPLDWVFFVNTLLAKQAEDRYQSAQDVLEAATHLPI